MSASRRLVGRVRLAALLALCAAGASAPATATAGPAAKSVTVELRGRAGTRDVQAVTARPDGLQARGAAGGDGPSSIRWSTIRAVRGSDDPGVARWLAAGDDLWRGRERVLRGDWSLAREPLQRAFAAWQGATPSADGMLAAVACAEAHLRAGDAPAAVRPAFEAVRLARAGEPAVAAADGAPFVAAQARIGAGSAPAPVGLSPLAFDAAASARVRAAMDGFDPGDDAGLRDAVQAYLGALEGGTAPERRAGKLPEADRAAIDALDAFRLARSPDAKDRLVAVERLRRGKRATGPWPEDSVRLALAVALAADEDRAAREAGLLLAASVAAAPDRAGPALAARAAAWFASPPPPSGRIGQPALLREQALRVPRDLSGATAEWLVARGQADLLLALLELQLASGQDVPGRAQAVVRLAGLLSERLEREDDEARRAELVGRALGIVEREAAGSESLRLAVLRAQFRSAQRAAESRRAGRAGDAQAAAAHGELRALVAKLADLTDDSLRAQAAAAREAARASGARAEELLDDASRAEQVARSAAYFRAWGGYYAAWLGRQLGAEGWRDDAAAAARVFAWLLDPDRPSLDTADVSEDLRGNESFASAILGMGLVSALLDEGPAADRWLALLESPDANASVRSRLPFWRLAVALDRNDLPRALAILRAEEGGDDGASMCVVAAAHASRAGVSPESAALMAEAVGRLASAGRLRELSSASLGPVDAEGPAARLVSAVRAVADAARRRDAGDRAGAEERWRAAESELRLASGPDAPAAVAAGASGLRALVLRNLGRFAEAADAFRASAASLRGELAGDARWNAVLCLDEAARGGDAAARARCDREVDGIVAELPASRAAVRAHAWRASSSAEPAEADIEALLSDAVPNDLAPAARRAATEALHRRFRAATGSARSEFARRALEAGDGIAPTGAEAVDELRRRCEMALAVGDLARLSAALDALEERLPPGSASSALAAEVAARRVQRAVLEGRYAAARDGLAALAPASPAGRAAATTLLSAALRDPSCEPSIRAVAARALAIGEEPPSAWAVAAWLSAEAEILAAGGEGIDPEGAASAARACRTNAPGEPRLLLAEAAFLVARGDGPGGAAAVAELLSRAEVGSAPWLAAKELQVRVLAATDPARARAVLEQARALAGGFGDGPEGERLRALDERLPRDAPEARP